MHIILRYDLISEQLYLPEAFEIHEYLVKLLEKYNGYIRSEENKAVGTLIRNRELGIWHFPSNRSIIRWKHIILYNMEEQDAIR